MESYLLSVNISYKRVTSVVFHKNNHPKIHLKPKRHNLEGQILLPFSGQTSGKPPLRSAVIADVKLLTNFWQ